MKYSTYPTYTDSKTGNICYKVRKNDTLSEISEGLNKQGFSTSVSSLATLNNIQNVNLIYVDQVLIVKKKSSSSSSGSSSGSSKPLNTVTITKFDRQAGSDNTIYANWTWPSDKAQQTDHYQIRWWYGVAGVKDMFIGTDTTVGQWSVWQTTYSPPDHASRVRLSIKPVAQKYKGKNGKETSYWTADWSPSLYYYMSDFPPSKPNTPSVKIEDFKLTAELDNIASDINAKSIEFQIVQDDKTVYKTGVSSIVTWHAEFTCDVAAGSEYKVRCRAVKDKLYSDWSEFSNNEMPPPKAPSGFTECRADTKTSVFLKWEEDSTATGYDIEYSTEKRYLGASDQTTVVDVGKVTAYTKTGLESGKEYFFRLRSKNSKGESEWSGIKSVLLGEKPSAPTTWSSSTSVTSGETVSLYWLHNARDGSKPSKYHLKILVDGVSLFSGEYLEITDDRSDDEKESAYVYRLSTSGSKFGAGSEVKWCVQTAGITGEFGDWSVMRTVNVYSKPTLSLRIVNSSNTDISNIQSFPFYIRGTASPVNVNHKPIGYHVSIIANESYETIDYTGNTKIIKAGDTVYSKYFDSETRSGFVRSAIGKWIKGSLVAGTSELLIQMSAGNIDLETNVEYTIKCIVSMNSGLTASASKDFTVTWYETNYLPNAEISIDEKSALAYISPYCKNDAGNYVSGVTLSVYRKDFDGKFTEIQTGISNNGSSIVDPHPSLNYARYRIVAVETSTGGISFYDLPPYPVDESAIILQWDEKWTDFHTQYTDELARQPWAGSLLKLPYNVDISESNSSDVELVEYIGREHPVTYYGTQLGETATWNTDIPADDEETLYALRRLSKWMGDVYVREPSGVGYWAQVAVSFSKKHCEVTIPVTLNITRVEGGI